jgi:ribosomal protein L7Ae-like RNA K-turn-binding protein
LAPVVIAHDVDPIKLVIFRRAILRKMNMSKLVLVGSDDERLLSGILGEKDQEVVSCIVGGEWRDYTIYGD